jgi:hypothetical protein
MELGGGDVCFRDFRSSKAVIMMLLLCSGDVETNLGPRYP